MCESQTTAAPQEATHQGEPTDAIVFVVITMVVGVFTLHLLSFTKIPYTALLLVRSSLLLHLPPDDHKLCSISHQYVNDQVESCWVQVWGVIFGVGNQSFSQNWKYIGEGTRLWEVS